MINDYKKITVNFDELTNLNIRTEPVYLTVLIDDIPFEFLVNLKEKSKKMLVFGSGAYDPRKISPPIFNRFSWKDEFDCTTIYYNDPTLYLDGVNLGWAYGTKKRHYIKDIANIIRRIKNNLSIHNKDILFYGSSGGGFTSLMLAGIVKGSKAFVNNPQTDITNYYKTSVENLHEAVYGNRKNNSFDLKRTSVIELYKKLEHVPEIFYAQNLACKHDMENHLMPFIEGLNQLNDEIIDNKVVTYYYSNKEQGHNPLDKQTTLGFINKILNLKK